MKIIKDSRKENTAKQITCGHCRSTLEVTPADIVRKSYDQRDGDAYVFTCAVCRQGIWVDMHRFGWSCV